MFAGFRYAEKCAFSQTSIEFLGHIIDEHGIPEDPEKTSAIRRWKIFQVAQIHYGKSTRENFTPRCHFEPVLVPDVGPRPRKSI